MVASSFFQFYKSANFKSFRNLKNFKTFIASYLPLLIPYYIIQNYTFCFPNYTLQVNGRNNIKHFKAEDSLEIKTDK